MLSDLTKIMMGDDISGRLSARLSGANINPSGFRTALSQSVAKNTGENFINALVYLVADALKHQDDVLIDKGLPPPLKKEVTLLKSFAAMGQVRQISILIEADLMIFSRSQPQKAILLSAKTRLKEVFHIGTMWKILFDMLGDNYCQKKWGLSNERSADAQLIYTFATADMIPRGGTNTQGPDVERDQVRNLIAMDASFFDYVFVSKSDIGHVSSVLNVSNGREALFHTLGLLLDLVEQTYSNQGFSLR